MEKIVFAGSFDPLTNGHLWVIQEGLEIAKKVAVFVAENASKKTMFTAEERKKMIEESCAFRGFGNRVEVTIVSNEYVAKKAYQVGASHLIRGIRSAMDFDYEELIQKTNVDVLGGAKTVFVMPPRDLESVSSSFVKSLMGPVGWHWHVKEFLPYPVYKKVVEDFITKVAKSNIEHEKLDDFLKLVFANYSQENRHYHNLEHIAHCLQEMIWLQKNSDEQVNYDQLCAAILAHDIVYGAKKEVSDEVLSAELLIQTLGEKFKPAYKMVVSTQHFIDKKRYTKEEKIMRSIDLTILAQDKKIYKKYAKNVRKEYSYVEQSVYIEHRKKALEKLINDEKLFEYEKFSHYEQLAKKNLKKELEELKEK